MNNTLFHRGPDVGDTWVEQNDGIAFGHRRLSIVDLSHYGDQPMRSLCGRYIIVFNGEIYNYKQLMNDLIASSDGIKLNGHSDTEILLNYISVYGLSKALKKTIGMFAFALWDNVEKTLVLSRDRFGEKPLYYGWIVNNSSYSFVFASELKAIMVHPNFANTINSHALSLYFQHCYVPAPYSIYNHIHKLQPGSYIKLTSPKIINPKPEYFWKINDVIYDGIDNQITDERIAISLLDDALNDAVKLQSNADVPLGAFLSGGIDSSLIVALIQNNTTDSVKTYTIGFDNPQFDESKYASQVADYLSTDHNELILTEQDALDIIPDIPSIYDEPFADSSQIPTYLVSKFASSHVKVAMSGDGGDELFGGYNRYFWGARIWNKIAWMPHTARKLLGELILRIPAHTLNRLAFSSVGHLGSKMHKLAFRLRDIKNPDDLYHSLITEWPIAEHLVYAVQRTITLIESYPAPSVLVEPELRMMFWDTNTYLPDDILVKVDRASMSTSLETRAPFLDHRIAELAWRLPLDLKINNNQGKWALRQVLYRYVPQNIVDRPKTGFGIPMSDWLRGPLKHWAEGLLFDNTNNNIIDMNIVRTVWSQHCSGTHDWSTRIWIALMYLSWEKNI